MARQRSILVFLIGAAAWLAIIVLGAKPAGF
jgi:hypothetical protein